MNVRGILAAAAATLLVLCSSYQANADSEFAVLHPTFYVLAPGGDAGIAPVVSAVVGRLQALFDAASPGSKVWVIPRTGWGPDDLFNQCANDPTKTSAAGARVLGGLILDGTNTYSSGVNSYVLWIRGWSRLSTNAELVSCTPTGFTTPTITWVSNDVNGYGARNGFPVETGIPLALYFGSTTSSDAKSVALGASIGALESSNGIPPVDPVDTVRDAAHRAANDLIDKLVGSCKTPDVSIRPMCAKLGLAEPPPATPPPPPAKSPAPDSSGL